MYIVQGEEAQPEYLVRDEKVADVGSTESSAGGTVAVRIEWARIGAILGALDVETTVSSEGGAIPAHARRGHAVEQVHAAPNRFDQVLGKSYTHQVARMRFRQRVVDDFDHLVHRVFFLANRESADPKSRPIAHRLNRRGGLTPEMRVNAALDDGEQRLVIARILTR